jgi:hypothetical protein
MNGGFAPATKEVEIAIPQKDRKIPHILFSNDCRKMDSSPT